MHLDWPNLTSLLSPAVTKKFQHASVHNPLDTKLLSFPRRSPKKSDVLFSKKKAYRLPQISAYCKSKADESSTIQ